MASPLIIRGQKATLLDFPWQVSLQNNDGHFCGGSIISKRHILTAAHCLVVSNIKVYAGGDGSVWKLRKLGSIKNTILHENWLRTRRLNDIGLIEMSEDIVFSNDIAPIKLAEKKHFKIGNEVILSGFGVTVDPNISGEILYPTYLQSATLILAPKFSDSKYWSKQLSTYYAEKYDEYKDSVMVDVPKRRHEERKGGCYADSGGPLVMKDSKGETYLLGLVSKMIEGCGISTIFTDVYEHRSWVSAESK